MNKRLLSLACGAVIVTGLVAVTVNDVGARTRTAKATLATAAGIKVGSVEFSTDRGHTEVRVRIFGAPGVDAFHGFHVHANDVVSPTNGEGCIADPAAASSTWFVSADGHYNPTAQTHAHHVGDMPVVYVNADGSVDTRFRIDRIPLGDLQNKVVILHAGPDNYANIPLGTGASQYTENSPDASTATGRTGNAGDRLLCGVIAVR